MSDAKELSKEADQVDWAMLRRALARTSMIAYIRMVAPWFTVEEVHCAIALHLEAMISGELDRLLITMPPRTGKSLMGSVFFPSFWAGNYPSDKILQVGHSVELSRGFSLDVRSTMREEEYQWIFPGVRLAKDSQAAGKWRVEDIATAMARLEAKAERAQQGQYNAAGVTSNLAGKGFHLGVADDLMSEQDKDSKVMKDRIKNWWGPGFYTRRQPERNAILLMMTRWGTDDIAGHLEELAAKHHGADVYTKLNVPAILDAASAKQVYTMAEAYGQIKQEDLKPLKAGDSFAPRRWSLKELGRSKANMTDRDWNALYLGKPTVDEGHILKRRHWRLWPHDDPPECIEIFQMYDTAFEKNESADNSARTTWGLFEYRETQGERAMMNMVLLDRWEKKVDAPDLRTVAMVGCWGSVDTRKALEEMKMAPDLEFLADMVKENGGRELNGMYPDRVMVENKASGLWLNKELKRITKPRRMPISMWRAPRGARGKELSKYARAHYGNLVLEQGAVWYMNRKWAGEVIDLCAQCKFDDTDKTDDLPDTVVASMIHVRQTYRVELKTDIDEEAEKQPKRKTKRQFYGART